MEESASKKRKRENNIEGKEWYLRWEKERLLALGEFIENKDLCGLVTDYLELSALEKEIVQRADIGCKWKRTSNQNAAFTLSYGTFEVGMTWAGAPCRTVEEFEQFEETLLPCCWDAAVFPAPLDKRGWPVSSMVRFKGVHLFVVPISRSDAGLFEYAQHFREAYLDTKPVGNTIHPNTYDHIVGDDVYRLLENRFHLTGASWWYLPSDCYSCS
jgi:hypothetical protein